ncbi:MAG: DUF3040 domain-containing protein [Acidobacteria bacterium]|nr:DUF3040 domain-containing protein [Acidobacteriota bacterium]
MPLSDHEQRILNSLEESLESDPRFVGTLEAMRASVHRRQTRIVSLLGFVVGLAILVAFFTQSVLIGILGVGLMLGTSLLFVETLNQKSGTWRR